jgi:hypothetical protein
MITHDEWWDGAYGCAGCGPDAKKWSLRGWVAGQRLLQSEGVQGGGKQMTVTFPFQLGQRVEYVDGAQLGRECRVVALKVIEGGQKLVSVGGKGWHRAEALRPYIKPEMPDTAASIVAEYSFKRLNHNEFRIMAILKRLATLIDGKADA